MLTWVTQYFKVYKDICLPLALLDRSTKPLKKPGSLAWWGLVSNLAGNRNLLVTLWIFNFLKNTFPSKMFEWTIWSLLATFSYIKNSPKVFKIKNDEIPFLEKTLLVDGTEYNIKKYCMNSKISIHVNTNNWTIYCKEIINMKFKVKIIVF